MQIILVLSALAVVCFGAAIPAPQEWGSATTISGRPQPTYTFVVPCFPGVPDCVPTTLTYGGGAKRAAAATAIAREADPQVLGSPSRTVLLPTYPVPTTKKSTSTRKTHYKRQELGSPSRTVLLPTYPQPPPTATPKPPTSTKKPIWPPWKRQELGSPSRTVLLPTYPPPPITTSKPPTSTKKPIWPPWKRQELGSPTRTVLLPTPPVIPSTTSRSPPHLPTKPGPWWPPTVTVTVTHYPTSTAKSTTTKGPDTSRYTSTGDASTRVNKRQLLGSPSRTQFWPWPIPTHVTVTVTHTPPPPPPNHTFTSRPIPTTFVVPVDKRQEVGEPSRTDLLPAPSSTSIPIWTTKPAPIVSVITETLVTTIKYPTTVSVIKTTTDIITKTTCTEEPTTWDSWPTYPVTSRTTSNLSGTTTRTVSTILTAPVDKRQELGAPFPSFTPPPEWVSLPDATPVPTRSYNKRQEIGAPFPSFTPPPESVSLPDATPIPTRSYNKRQELGSPSRSFTYIVPTTTGRTVTYYREI